MVLTSNSGVWMVCEDDSIMVHGRRKRAREGTGAAAAERPRGERLSFTNLRRQRRRLLRLELKHLRRAVVLLLIRVHRILAEIADLALALHTPQRLTEDTAFLLTEPLNSVQLLLPTSA